MKTIRKRLGTPAGLVLATAVALVLLVIGLLVWASPPAALAAALMGLPLLGAALAADRETQQKEAGTKSYPAAAVKIYKGSLVCANASGYAAPAADTASFRTVGIAAEFVDNSAGSAGDKSIRVLSGRVFRFAASSITQAMVGQMMYVVDDQTFDDGIGTNAVKAGQLAEYISATEGWLFIPAGGVGNAVSAADGGATYGAAEQTLLNQIKARLNTYLHAWPLFLAVGAVLYALAAGGWVALLQALPFLAMGLVVNSDTLAAIRTDFEAIFLESYQGLVPRWMDLATEFPANSQFLDLSWLGEVPAIKQWLDEKVLEGLRRFRYQLENLDWEATIELDRNAIEDDTLGIYRPRIQGLGQEARRHPDDLVSSLLINGDSATLGKAFDASAFFLTTRTVGDSGTINNIVTGTGTTQAQFQADYVSAKKVMAAFKNDRGKPFNPDMSRLVVVCPPALEFVAKQTFNATIIAQTQNILIGEADVWSNAYLGGASGQANDWYLLNVGGPIKPLAVSMRKRPVLLALDNPQSDTVFKRRRFLYSVEARYNAGYLLPWQAMKIDNS